MKEVTNILYELKYLELRLKTELKTERSNEEKKNVLIRIQRAINALEEDVLFPNKKE